jgi:SAM-dependent methyltransferase
MGGVDEAARYWRERLAEWAIPAAITDAVTESPWTFPVEEFASRARRSAEHPVGASYARAVEALADPGTVLDVGAGAGAASLPLLGTGRVTGLTAVDTSTEMLDALRDNASVPTRTLAGRWPDIAAQAPVADVVVCHHVFYNVAELADFAAALTAHARRRVVVELTEAHPMVALNPLWTVLHGLARPTRPTATDAVAVLREAGLVPDEQRWDDPDPAPALTDAAVESTRRRLCLPPERRVDVEAALRAYPLRRLARCTLWWDAGR